MAEVPTIHPPPGAGIPALRYSSCVNATTNFSLAFCLNDTIINDEHQVSLYLTQRIVAVVVPLLFGIIVFVGLIGNALVSIGPVQCSYSCLLTGSTRTLLPNAQKVVACKIFFKLRINCIHGKNYPNQLLTN